MSRAINLDLAEADVVARCKSAGVVISAIETLVDGGTHLVTLTGDGAAVMRRKLSDHIIAGRVRRFAYIHPGQPRRLEASSRASPSARPWRNPARRQG